MSIWLQTSAWIQERTSPLKYDHFRSKIPNFTASNLSTKAHGSDGVVGLEGAGQIPDGVLSVAVHPLAREEDLLKATFFGSKIFQNFVEFYLFSLLFFKGNPEKTKGKKKILTYLLAGRRSPLLFVDSTFLN